MARYTKGIPRRTPKPAGQREIDLRLRAKPVPVKSTSASRQRRLTSTATEEVTDEPIPVGDQDLRCKINARSEESEPMEEDTEDLQKDTEPTPVPIDVSKEKPVFKNTDCRTEWDRRTEFIRKMISAFDKEWLPCAGTKELTRFLQDMTVPRKAINELIPEKLKILREEDMETVKLRVQTLSHKALDSKKDADCQKRRSSSASTGGESLGQPGDSSAPKVDLDLGDLIEE